MNKRNLIRDLRRNYQPFLPKQCGTCGKPAWGSTACADCCEKQLAELTNPELAKRFHQATKDIAAMVREFEEKIDV